MYSAIVTWEEMKPGVVKFDLSNATTVYLGVDARDICECMSSNISHESG